MILLTGASGVIGCELAPRLPQAQLMLARHRTRPDSSSQQIAIDIRDPKLGLTDEAYRVLADEIETIIHCAAITDMSGQVPELSATNISGVEHIVAFAKAADANLHFVSTAYCSQTYGSATPVASDYVASKRAAEQVVRESNLNWTILRPSIIAGHSETGQIASFQGFHLFIATILKGRLPFMPVTRQTQCDFIPVDWVAASIANIVEAPEWGRTYWLTSGAQALSVDQMMITGTPFATARGRDLEAVAMLSPEQVEAEILPTLRPRARERLSMLVNLSKVMTRRAPFPSDVPGVTAAGLESALLSNLDYWGTQTA
ncbi:MAG: SDR family oxidoreductase [Pseudomonadota bacterium]